jgi:hypothetical protein
MHQMRLAGENARRGTGLARKPFPMLNSQRSGSMADRSGGGGGNSALALLVGALLVIVLIGGFFLYSGGSFGPGGGTTHTVNLNVKTPAKGG